jgi:hypothetical protein
MYVYTDELMYRHTNILKCTNNIDEMTEEEIDEWADMDGKKDK